MNQVLAIFTVLLFATLALGQKSVEQQESFFRNYMFNPGFESGKGPHTSAGVGTTALSADARSGTYSLEHTFTSANGTLLRSSYGGCYNMGSSEALMSGFYIKTTTANLQICSMLGNNEQQCVDVPSTGAWTAVFPTMVSDGASGCGYKIKTTSSTTGSYKVDDGYIGKNPNVGTVAQAEALVRAQKNSPQSITSTNNTQISFQNELKDVYGEFDASTGLFTSNKARTLQVSAQVLITNYTVGDGAELRVFKNGVTTNCAAYSHASAVTHSIALPPCLIDVAATDTVYVAVKSGTDTSYTVNSSDDTSINIASFPSQAEQVQNLGGAVDLLGTLVFVERGTTCPLNTVEANGGTIPAQYGELIAYIGSTTMPDYRGLYARNIGTGTLNARSKVGPTNPGDKQEDEMQGHNHSGSGALLLGQQSTSGFNSGLTSGGTGYNKIGLASDSSPGNINNIIGGAIAGVNGTPRTGNETRVSGYGVRPCMVARRTTLQAAKASVISGDLNAITTINKVTDYSGGATTLAATAQDETFNFAPSGAVTLTLPPVASVPGKKYTIRTTGTQQITIDPSGSETVCGQTTIKVFGTNDVIEIQAAGTAWIPTSTGGCNRTVSADVVCSASSTVQRQDFPVFTIGNVSGGQCVITTASGTFSATPYCTISGESFGASTPLITSITPSTTSGSIDCADHAATACSAWDATFSCTGPR